MSINRNILECKEIIFISTRSFFLCINRNILECKEYKMDYVFAMEEVLIETYWNVNASDVSAWAKSSTY